MLILMSNANKGVFDISMSVYVGCFCERLEKREVKSYATKGITQQRNQRLAPRC